MGDQRSALEDALGVLTRARHISVYLGEKTVPDEYIGHVLFNDTHVIINCEDGRKVFLHRTAVVKLEEKPLGSV